ncbi:hypothetical protein EDB84DRAFT_1575670 [Lactarius hengduanensis]|nr:hypothetical protein EDB84DRAFT_1575670 [Lactarius hengduanensis]
MNMNLGQDSPTLSSSSRPSCGANLNALPVELLAYIFTFCTEVSDNPHLPKLRYPAWLPITHVCRYWRTIALSHAPLWTSITCGLSLRWIKIFMERSRPMLTNFDVQIAPLGSLSDVQINAMAHYQEDIILLLSDFTRIGSLCLTGTHSTIRPIIDSLCRCLPVHTLSLRLEDNHKRNCFTLPDDLFMGNAPIRYLQFTAGCQIVAPHWLLHSVTHFTSAETISPSELLDALRQMPALTYLEFHPLAFLWGNLDLDKLRASQIYMPHLMNLIAHTSYFPGSIVLLNQLLSLRAGAKRRVELHPPEFCGWAGRKDWIEGLSPILKAADGFRHIHFSREQKEGWFRLWTGTAATAWEDAEFCIFSEWSELGGANAGRSDSPRFVALGVAQVRKLVIDLPSPHPEKFWYRKKDLSRSYWWELLEKLPGIEELELRSTVERRIAGAWEVSVAPAVLPALRRVRIVAPKLDLLSPQYAIIGDFPTRRIMRLPNSTEGDVTSFPEVVSVEKELENISSGLLALLQGLAG